jgi:hypothetical protein
MKSNDGDTAGHEQRRIAAEIQNRFDPLAPWTFTCYGSPRLGWPLGGVIPRFEVRPA